MVFSAKGNEIIKIFDVIKDKSTTINSGFDLTGQEINNLVNKFNLFYTKQDFGDEWIRQLDVVRYKSSNVAVMLEDIAKKGGLARVNVEKMYAAILNGNTRGLSNVKSIINTFNSLSPNNQEDFAMAVSHTNAQLGGYLKNIKTGSANLANYGIQLVKAKSQTVLLRSATMLFNTALSAGVGFLLNTGIKILSDYVVTQKEALEAAKDSAKEYKTNADNLSKLKKEYENILDSEKTEVEKTQELSEWKQTLVDVYGFEKEALEDINTERKKGNELLDEEIEKTKHNDRADWLAENKDVIEKSIKEINENYAGLFDLSGFSENDKIRSFFDKSVDMGFMGSPFEIKGNNLIEQYENIEQMITEMGNRNNRTSFEELFLSSLIDEKNRIKKILDEYRDTFETYYDFKSLNLFDEYVDNNPIKDVGKDSYLAWKDGLIESAEDDKQLQKELTELAEKQFSDYEKYYQNFEKLKKKYVGDNDPQSKESGERLSFLFTLSDEDLEIATKIPNLFKNGLDGAADLIEEFKKNNPISADVDTEGIQSLADIAETTSKKVTALKTAMSEMSDTGELTIETYNSLVELGGNFADCITIQNGKIKVNTDRLKDLEKQSYDNSIAANELAIAELQLQAVSLKGVGTEWITDEITRLELENAALREAKTAIENAQPDDKDTGSGDDDSGSSNSEKPDLIVKFEKELAEKQHEINMGRMKEDAAYWDWYESAYKKAYEGQKDYQDDMYKHEEAVYNGRKKLAENAFEAEQKAFKERITNYDAQIEVTTKDSTDFEGKKLDASERYDYIRSVYDDILSEINRRIGEIIESGIEGHEEEIKELEEMYEEYTGKRESTYDDEINHEISVLEKLKDKESDRFDEQIKKLEEQKDAVEDSYDAEIKKIDEKIKAIEDENDEQERLNDLEKTRQELEKSSQRTRKVYGSNGMVEYRQDDEAIAEAQKNYDNAKKDIEIAELEKQKEALEANKEAEISKYDEMINAVNQQKDSQIQYWDYLIDILESYLNPDSLESSSELWDRILGDREKVRQEQGQTIVNGQAIDNPNGKTANANEINENINNAIKANTETAESNANAAKANEESAKAKQQEETTSISPEEAEMKFAQTLGQFFMNGLLLANNGMTASSQFMNEQHGEAATAVNTNNAVNNYNNSPITNTFTIGDIRITNPVGNSDDLAKELRMNIPISFQNQIYSNKKK